LLSGSTPFDASQTLPELVTAILEKPAPSLHELRPAIPQELAAIIAKCLAKNKEERYESVAQLASALLPFAPVRARGPAERALAMAAAPLAKPRFDVIEGGARLAAGESPGVGAELLGHPSNSQVVTLKGDPLGSMAPSALDVSASPQAKDTWRRSALGLGGAAAALVVVLIVWVAAGSGPGQASKTAASPSPAPQAANAPAAPVTVPASPIAVPGPVVDLADLEVRVSPSSAQITIDGESVTGNPFHGRYAKDGATHFIRASAFGFRTKTKQVSLTSSVVLDLSLDVVATWPDVSAAPRSTRSGASAAGSARRGAANPARVDAPAVPASVAVNPAGGRAPLHPIETANPYQNQ